MNLAQITTIFGSGAQSLLQHQCSKITKEQITIPNKNHVSSVFGASDRSKTVINNLKHLYNHGRLAKTDYLSILPVDQGVEHTAAYSFYKNPIYFDLENIVKLNHNELLTYPTKHDQHTFARAEQAHNLGASGVGATIYYGSKESNRQIEEVSWAFAKAHELGMFTILWCYTRNPAWRTDTENYEQSVDITSQAIHLGVTI